MLFHLSRFFPTIFSMFFFEKITSKLAHFFMRFFLEKKFITHIIFTKSKDTNAEIEKRKIVRIVLKKNSHHTIFSITHILFAQISYRN